MFDDTAVDYGQERGNYSRRVPGIYKDGKGGFVKVNSDRSVSPYKPTLADKISLGLAPIPAASVKRDPGYPLPTAATNPLSDFEKDPAAFMKLVNKELSTVEETSTPKEEPLAPGEKRNANGIIQKGKDLSSSNLGRQMLLELPELDANRFIQSEGPTPAPGAGMNLNMPGISADTATVPFKVPDEAGPSFAIEPSPEANDAVAYWKSQDSSPTLPSSYSTDFTPLPIDISESKTTEEKIQKGKASGINWMKSRQPGSVSEVRANAMYSTIGEGPMAFIRQRNSELGINAGGNIAKIDGQNYNINPEQYKAMLDGAGMTREGLDAIKNAATPYVAPGTATSDVSARFDTSKLSPAEAAAVEATAQPIMGVQDLVPTNPDFSTKGMTDENAEEFMKRFRAALQAGA